MGNTQNQPPEKWTEMQRERMNNDQDPVKTSASTETDSVDSAPESEPFDEMKGERMNNDQNPS